MQRSLHSSCLLVILSLSYTSDAQVGHSNSTPKRGSAPATTTSQATSAATSDVESAVAANGVAKAVLQTPDDRADYVPCKFTYNELQSLVTPERVERLTPSDAEKLVVSVMDELQKQQDANQLRPLVAQMMIAQLKWSALAGLTPTQAVSVVTGILSKARSLAALVAAVSAVENNRTEATQQAAIALDLTKTSKERENATQALRNLEVAAANSNAQAIAAAPGKSDRSTDEAALLERSQTALNVIEDAKKSVAAKESNQYLFYRNYASQQNSKDSPVSSAQAADQATVAAASVIGKAQQTVNHLVRPDDIGCAMSVLSYNETKLAYGSMIANEYITVQVVVRNLSREQQFILHDVEFATNVDPSGRIGRFYSGRDRIVVRALSQTQQLFNARNIFVGGAELTSSIMASASLIYGGALSDASKVMASAFVPGLGKIWADVSKDQSNLLNDTGFTSRTNSQIVVPTVGSTMFVTFIPQKEFEQGWWARKCATKTFFPNLASINQRELEKLTSTSALAGTANIAATGIDVQHALAACRIDAGTDKTRIGIPGDPDATTTNLVPKQQQSGDQVQPKDDPAFGIAVSAEKNPFKKWSGNSIALFQELSTVVVAGIHIIDDKQLQPVVTDLKCDTDKDTGKLNWPSSTTAKIACTLTGRNLVKIKSLRAQNADDGVDTATAAATLTLDGGDNTSARVSFDGDTLHKLKGTNYVLVLTDELGAEQKTGLMLHLPAGAYVSKFSPDTLDMNSSLPDNVRLDGYHLKDVQKLILNDVAGPVALPLAVIPASDDSTRYFQTTGATWDKLGKSAATVTVQLLDGTGAEVKINSKTVAFTPKLASTTN